MELTKVYTEIKKDVKKDRDELSSIIDEVTRKYIGHPIGQRTKLSMQADLSKEMMYRGLDRKFQLRVIMSKGHVNIKAVPVNPKYIPEESVVWSL